jgi:RNA polymerase sigma-70 factor (ECF subfamily)
MSQHKCRIHQTNGGSIVNAQTFGDWHHQYHGRLLNSMTAMVRDRSAAEDITSTALATAWQKRNQFRGEASLYTWVHRIAINESRHCTSQRRTVSIDALDTPLKELTEAAGMNSHAQDRTDDSIRLRKALQQLPALHRRTLVDHFFRGYPVKRIAQRDRIPVGTVLSRIFTAKRRLRAAWDAVV